MKHPILFSTAILLTASAWAQADTSTTAVQTSAEPKTISAKEMLLTGPSPMKLHALAMVARDAEKEGLDESYLPAFKVCAEDSDELVRNLTAKLLGQHFIKGESEPNSKAVNLLIRLAKDESPSVRYNAIYYGLAALDNKSKEIIQLLVEQASTERDTLMNEHIAKSLENYRDETAEILNQKMKTAEALNYFEIYKQLSGKNPVATEQLLNMPSSRPIMFVFIGQGRDSDKFKAELETELKELGLSSSELSDSGSGDNYVVMFKTYITRDRVKIEEAFSNHKKFRAPQEWWLTPQFEVEFEEMRNK